MDPQESLRSSWGLECYHMPKMKTHKGSAKRFRVSAGGKLKRTQAGKKHLNSHKSGKRKRHLRAKITEVDRIAQKYVLHI